MATAADILVLRKKLVAATSGDAQKPAVRSTPPALPTQRCRARGGLAQAPLTLEPVLDDRLRRTELCRSGEARCRSFVGSHDALHPASPQPSGAVTRMHRLYYNSYGPGRSHFVTSVRPSKRLASAHHRSPETALLQSMSDSYKKLTKNAPVNRKRSRS